MSEGEKEWAILRSTDSGRRVEFRLAMHFPCPWDIGYRTIPAPTDPSNEHYVACVIHPVRHSTTQCLPGEEHDWDTMVVQ